MEFLLPRDVEYILSQYEKAGYEAHCVGGCVRDMLMGLTPQDYDIATNAPCEVTVELFPKVIPTGIKHGTVTVVMDDGNYEITRYRIDGEYRDHRRPESVEFTDDFKLDLSRRDFTVNAIGYNPRLGLCDPFHGSEDIKAGLIRTVGEPNKRFSEDALRILRGIRFSSRLGFNIEKSTLDSIIKNAASLSSVSAERIAVEIIKTMEGEKPSLISLVINSGGLKDFGLTSCDNISVLDRLPVSPLLRLGALIYLCGADATLICENLRLSNAQKSYIIASHEILGCKQMDLVFLKQKIKALGYQGCADAIDVFAKLHNVCMTDLKEQLEYARNQRHPYCQEMLCIKGGDIKNLGFAGPDISKIMNILLDKVLHSPELNTPEKLKKIISNL